MECREAQRDSEGRVRRLVTGIGSEMNQLAVIEMVRRGQNPEVEPVEHSGIKFKCPVRCIRVLETSPLTHGPCS